MEGDRVAFTVDGERYEGTVVRRTYTVKGGEPVVAVDLDDPLPDGRERHLVPATDTEPI